ncbi:MAG: J domain-containing protein [Desulfobulbaceae bacterium]|nr:J domain-containing protein [Desulfobulbaceae bacterium]HIJ79451.1 J domain-containing protein [Deltaproteobacteria bacterium]
MPVVVAEKELFRACEVIFGAELNISREFLEYLQLSGIKSAYRKRAMETHPDRMTNAAEDARQQSSDLFMAVQGAYENLITFLDAREKGYRLPSLQPRPTARRPTRPAHRPSPARPAYRSQPNSARANNNFHSGQARPESSFWNIENLYCGPMPNRRLLLGHFMYYSGLINWRTLIQALIWQRTERPKLGELGCRFGMLTEKDVLHILKNRPTLQPFGKTALDMGLLTDAQLRMLIFHQKRLQRKFGEFFVEKKIMGPDQLRELLNQYQSHNAAIIGEFNRSRVRF